MKSFFTIFILMVLFLASTFSTSFAQLPWTKDANNPVLSYGQPGGWDATGVYTPFVLKDGDTLKMWYTGYHIGNDDQIGYATSTDDGITWNRLLNNPVLDLTLEFFEN